MGMYDYIRATCPSCNAEIEDQIKIDCCFADYNLNEPMSISEAEFLIGCKLACFECGKSYEVIGDIPTHKVNLYLKEIK